MKTNRWMSVAAVSLLLAISFLPTMGFGAEEEPVQTRKISMPAGTQIVTLAEGQRVALRDGSYLTLKMGQITQVSRTGAAKMFPRGSQVFQDGKGQVGIWGSGGTTIVGTRSFDDPLLKPTTGLKGAYIDPALPRTVETKGAYIDPALPGTPPK